MRARLPAKTSALACAQRSLLAIGAKLRISHGRRLIRCDLSRIGERGEGLSPSLWLRVRELVYFLFNHLEHDYRVVATGVPYCLFPDAEDHVLFDRQPASRALRLAACASCKHRERCPGMPSRLLSAALNPPPVPDLPKEIVIEVTKDCNLDCKICFAGTGPARPSFPRIKELVRETKSLGIRSIRFTGGEPLLRPDILRLLEYAKSRGLYVILNTNATLVNPTALRALPRLVDNVLISLQGCDPFSDRRLTRGGVPYAAKLEHIARLADSGIGIVRLGTVMSDFLITRCDTRRPS